MLPFIRNHPSEGPWNRILDKNVLPSQYNYFRFKIPYPVVSETPVTERDHGLTLPADMKTSFQSSVLFFTIPYSGARLPVISTMTLLDKNLRWFLGSQECSSPPWRAIILWFPIKQVRYRISGVAHSENVVPVPDQDDYQKSNNWKWVILKLNDAYSTSS